MAKVAQTFQVDGVFQNNVFQKSWGGITFQKNVFQNNVFDTPQRIIKVLTETLATAENTNHLRSLIRFANEAETIQSFRRRFRLILRSLDETVATQENASAVRGLILSLIHISEPTRLRGMA